MNIRTSYLYSLVSVGVLAFACSPWLFGQGAAPVAGSAESRDPFVKSSAGGAVADPFAAGGDVAAAGEAPGGSAAVSEPAPFGPGGDEGWDEPGGDEHHEPVLLLEYIRTDLVKANQLLVEFGATEDAVPLRRRLEAMIDAGEAELVETCFLRTRNGMRMKTESVREHIYATEFEPPEMPTEYAGKSATMPMTSATPTAFEMRPVGETVEVEVTMGVGDPAPIHVNIAPEIVRHLSDRSLAPGAGPEHEIVMQPDFAVMKLSTDAVINEGGKSLLGVLNSPQVAGERVFVVLSADTLRPGVPERWEENEAEQAVTKKIAMHLEWIELGHRDANRLLNGAWRKRDAGELRAKLGEMIEAGDAQLVETCYGKGLSGQRLKIESVREHLYPTEWDPAEMPNKTQLDNASLRPTGANPTAIEARNVGTTVEIEPLIGVEKVVEVNIAPEIVEYLGDLGPGEDCPFEVKHMVQPNFYTMKLQTQVLAFVGQHNLVGTFTPSGDKDRRVLLLLKVDVLR